MFDPFGIPTLRIPFSDPLIDVGDIRNRAGCGFLGTRVHMSRQLYFIDFDRLRKQLDRITCNVLLHLVGHVFLCGTQSAENTSTNSVLQLCPQCGQISLFGLIFLLLHVGQMK